MAVSIAEKGTAVEIGTPRMLFQTTLADAGPFGRAYSVTPDGKRFLVEKQERGTAPPLTLVANWTSGLKK
jgi:hypothetical protein